MQHQVVGERLDLRDPAPGLVGHEVDPLGRRRASQGAVITLEVRCVEVGEDDEAVAPVVDPVLDVRLALGHEQRLGQRLGRRGARRTSVDVLASLVMMTYDAAPAQLEVDVVALVGLLVDEHVVALRRPHSWRQTW